jgi:uncharacterized protein (TIGR03437 family)
MSKLFSRNAIAVLALAFPIAGLADVTGTPTLSANHNVNLDTGATVASGGDISWNGTTLTVVGSATDVDLASTPLAAVYSGQSGYSNLVQSGSTLISQYSALFANYLTASAITPAVNDILIVHTNGGNYAAVLVTGSSGSSISVQFDTFAGSSTGGGGGPTGPTISSLQNNYSYLQPGLPSYGIAPGSLFIIFGSNLSDKVTPVLQSLSAPLPLTLNHTSISVTVNGKTTTPAIYYTSPTQIAAVLPSSTPTGSGTLTVTYNGTPSASTPILVTASAFGIDTLYGTGTGGIVATVGKSDIVPTDSASPGQTITIWGSGLGADTANDDRTFPLKQDNLKNAQVFIGGISASVSYAGRSQYPGVDQVNAVVPSVSGCGISVVVVANGRASNFGTLPVNAGGGVCSDPESGITGTDIGTLGGQTTVRSGSVTLFQETSPATASASSSAMKPEAQTFKTTYVADASFSSATGASYVTGGSFTSIGSCIVSQQGAGTLTTGTPSSQGLDAGTPISLAGGGQTVQIPVFSAGGVTEVGKYLATLTTPLSGGSAYTFTGPGGKDVGSFTATITFPVPLTWSNEISISAVTESQGQLITWTGGATGTYVEISGSSSSADFSSSASFFCLAPVGDQKFTVPSYVLLALPAGTGSLGVYNFSNPAKFTATGIDYGYAIAGVESNENVTYQ